MITTVSQKAPPDAINITDTTGCLLPRAAYSLVRFIKQLTAIPIEIHTHNDMGLGLANTLAAVEAGAEIVDVSVNGLGERGGNVSLDELVVALHFLYGRKTGIDPRRLTELARMVAKLSNIPLNRNKPLLGESIFWRESGLGIDLVKEHPLAMFSLVPETLGQKARIVLGKKSGLNSIEYKTSELGIKDLKDREQKKRVLAKVKERSAEKKGLIDDNEFLEIVSSVLTGT
jgi:methanogen homocitrate synthase